jgi:hypothetical protein
MNKTTNKIICCLILSTLFFANTVIAQGSSSDEAPVYDILSKINSQYDDLDLIHRFMNDIIESEQQNACEYDDIDPLVNSKVKVTIKEIRALDRIDLFDSPNFYVKVFINDFEYVSPVWYNQKYVKPNWSTPYHDVPDNIEWVTVKIQLWHKNFLRDKLCDISPNTREEPLSYDATMYYSLKTGHWTGDDYLGDPSGYGRLNGCDDNSMYQNDRDSELWFDITMNDYDGDGIPYWTEVNVYGTDPTVNDLGRDDDDDGVPIEWEWKWGHYFRYNWHKGELESVWFYDPFKWEDHANMDPDNDGLSNVEEYLTSSWGTDPFRRDMLLKLDQMEIGPNGEGALIPELSKDLLIDAFSKHNIVLRIDDEGELIPFDNSTTGEELQEMYLNYFLEGDPDHWRRGVFRYGLIIYNSAWHPGFVFVSSTNDTYLLDCFQISTAYHEVNPLKYPIYNIVRRKTFNKEEQRAIVYAGGIMHEMGHTLSIFGGNVPGCDNPYSVFPRRDWWKWRNYMSCMNYNYVYYVVDYSDGSRGRNDHDDWGTIDLTLFQRELFFH